MSLLRIELKYISGDMKKGSKETGGAEGIKEWLKIIFPLIDFDSSYWTAKESFIEYEELKTLPYWIFDYFEIKPIKSIAIKKLPVDLNRIIVEPKKVEEAIEQNIQFHFPGAHELLSISRVDWLEDECTENLQRKLNEGWRIIAVCLQAGNRRPDYVIGRSDKKIEISRNQN